MTELYIKSASAATSAIGDAASDKFVVKDGIITVTFGAKKKSTQLGDMDALALGEMLMSELVREAAQCK